MKNACPLLIFTVLLRGITVARFTFKYRLATFQPKIQIKFLEVYV
jgi:hypothetical protein